ncbi:MAG: serine hydrolase [Lacrimispora sp.]|nr:serine hydrolase [Lacrimispora sp.]
MNNGIIRLENIIAADYDNIAGIVVQKKGEVVYERYFDGFTSADAVHVMSVTKSILSVLIGIAIDQGYIQGPDQKVLDFFPDYRLKRGEQTIQHVTIENMLTMTAPYKYKSEPYTKVYTSDDWTKAALDLLGGKAGITGEFKYSTVGTQILSGIIINATGRSVLDFAAENLFNPLNINVPGNTTISNKEEHFAFLKSRSVKGWVVDPKGVNTAGWGLCLTPRDMAKIGQLYLNNGIYEGRKILSAKWIEESTKVKSCWGEFIYGYLWWIIDYEGDRCYAAIGDGGNFIFVNRDKSVVVAIASRFVPKYNVQIELITREILPLFK